MSETQVNESTVDGLAASLIAETPEEPEKKEAQAEQPKEAPPPDEAAPESEDLTDEELLALAEEQAEDDPEEDVEKSQDDPQAIPQDELQRGYLRQQDYTRKTQELAEQRRQIDSIQAELTRREQQTAALAAQFAAQVPQEPDWEAELRRVDAGVISMEDVTRAQTEWAAYNKKVEQARQYSAQVQGQREQQWRNHATQYLETERSHLVEHEDFKGDKLTKRQGELRPHAKQYGFSDEEINNVMDSRVVLMLNDAAKWQDLMSKKSSVLKKVSEAPPVTPPGTRRPRRSQAANQAREAQSRFKKSGDIEDMSAWLLTKE